jgi:biopolymer transport protein ExbD
MFNSLSVAVPKTEYSEAIPRDRDALVIAVTEQNTYFIEGQEIPAEGLAQWLQQKKQSDPSLVNVALRGDVDSRLQAIVDVLGACTKAGFQKVKIETERPVADTTP